MASAFPTYLPLEARRAFTSESAILRVVKASRWKSTDRVAELFASSASAELARLIGCSVTAIADEEILLTKAKEAAKQLGVSITTKAAPLHKLPLKDGEWGGVMSLGCTLLPLGELAVRARKWLARDGRFAFTFPVRVGRHPSPDALSHWETSIGETLRTPRDVLMEFESAGFEPELSECLGEAELDELYAAVEHAIAAGEIDDETSARLTADIACHRDLGGRNSVSFGMFVVRRKEPGEKPPVSRDRG